MGWNSTTTSGSFGSWRLPSPKKKQRILMDNKLLNILVAVYEGAVDIRLEFWENLFEAG